MASRQLVFDILANNKTGPGIRGAETDIQRLNRQWDQFKKAAVIASTAVVAGLAVMGKKAVDAASDLSESTNAVRVTFGDAADGILELGENAAEAVGLSNAQFNGLAVQFSSFANTVAGEGGDVVDVMGDLTGRAADFASVMNIDVDEAARTFQSGLAGETEPLKKYGINLSAAAVETYALANGIATAGEEMTEAQKIQARYGLLMEQTDKTAGDFQNTQDGMANASRVLTAQWTDLQAELGEKLLPYMESAIGVGRDMVAWMGDNEGVVIALVGAIGGLAATILAVTIAQKAWSAAQVVWTGVTTIASGVAKGFAAVTKAMNIAAITAQTKLWAAANATWSATTTVAAAVQRGFTAAMATGKILAIAAATKVWTALTTAWSVATTAATAVQKGLNAAMRANPIGAVITVIMLLVGAVILAYKESETFRNIVDKALDGIYSAWRWLWNNGIAPVIRFILNGFANITEGIGKMLRALGNIPGFGWAKDAADAMDNAAGRARAMAQGINDIPDRKTSTIALRVERGQLDALNRDIRALGIMGAFADGGYVSRTGPYLVGERGAEIVQLPAGARVYNAEDTERMRLDASRYARPYAGDESARAAVRTQPVTEIINLVVDGRTLAQAVRKHDRSLA